MKILFRSCGGLGNQIFQILFVRLLAEKYNSNKIVHYHESNYDRVANWEYPSNELFFKPNNIEKLILKFRLPKLFYRIGITKNEYINFFGTVIVDGYFQNYISYKTFDNKLLSQKIDLIKFELGVFDYKKKNSLYHLRLGDFFKNTCEEIEFVINFLNATKPEISIISNNDKLFNDNNEIKLLITSKNIKYINTSFFTSIELIKLFGIYNEVYSNGSSLAFISSILCNTSIKKNPSIKLNPYQEKNFNTLEKTSNFLKLNYLN
jgi:hypothetical protein